MDAADEIAQAWQRERPGTPTESIGVVTRIWQLGKLFAEERRRALAAAGIDAATLDLLSVLRRSGPPYRLTTRQLVERTLVTAGAISQRLARAERQHLVTRTPGPDRSVHVTLTQAGHDLIERSVDVVLRREAALLASLDPERREALADTLRTLLADVRTRVNG